VKPQPRLVLRQDERPKGAGLPFQPAAPLMRRMRECREGQGWPGAASIRSAKPQPRLLLWQDERPKEAGLPFRRAAPLMRRMRECREGQGWPGAASIQSANRAALLVVLSLAARGRGGVVRRTSHVVSPSNTRRPS